jgi:hypothetical protein
VDGIFAIPQMELVSLCWRLFQAEDLANLCIEIWDHAVI